MKALQKLLKWLFEDSDVIKTSKDYRFTYVCGKPEKV
jgi:hypothetical protein